MGLDREEVQEILGKVSHSTNTDYNVGALAVMLAASDPDDAELQEELLTALVYQQTIKYDMQSNGIAALTQGIAGALGISKQQVEVAGKKVYQMIVDQQEAANETQSNDSDKD